MSDSMGGYRFALALCVLAMLGCPHQLRAPTSALVNVSPTNDPSANLEKLPDSLVYVRAFCRRSESKPDVTGTAFVVGHSDGWSYLVSARHVLFPRECGLNPLSRKPPMAQRVELRGEGIRTFEGDPSELIEKSTDSQGDLILFHAQGRKDTPTARLSVLAPEMLGSGAEPMEALGFTVPQGRNAQPLYERSRGMLSKNNREGRLELATEARLYPSMSGGPVALCSSGLVVGVVLGEYVATNGSSAEKGRIATLAPLLDMLPEALRQQLGIVLHYSVRAAYQPPPTQPTWVVRPEQAKVLAVLDAVSKGQAPARVLLHGIGGVGKTTLAYQVAALRQMSFPGGTVKVVLNDRTIDLVLSDLIEALAGHRPQPGDWWKLLRAQLANRPPMLVILDNVRLDKAPWNQPETMDALLQALSPATLVMTSRSRQSPAGFTPLEIKSLPDEKATELMLKLAHAKLVTMSSAQAMELGRLLGGLPFALERAAELMHDDNHSMESLLATFRQDGRDPEKRLAQILEWQYEALDADAKAVLVALGQLAEAPVPEVLLAGLLPQTNRAHGLQRLLRSGLIDRTSPGATTYHQHTLLWEWAARLGKELHQVEVATLQQRMTESLKTHDEQVAPLLITHLLTAQRLAEERQQWDRVLGLTVSNSARLKTFGYWEAQKELLERALRASQVGTDRAFRALVLGDLGNLAKSQGLYEAARKYYQQSLDLAQAQGDHQVTAKSLLSLGTVASLQGDYVAAQKYYRQSLDLAQSQGFREVIAGILNNLGEVARLQRDYETAQKYYQQVLDLAQALGDSKLIASTLANLGNLALLRRDYVAALEYYQQSLGLTHAQGDREVIAGILNNLGEVARLQRDYEAAQKYYLQALDLAQALGARKLIASTLANLGNLTLSKGDYAAAREYYQQSLFLAQALGDRYVIGRVLWGQARLAAKTGRSIEARKLLDQAIQIFAALGDPALASAQWDRAVLGDAP